MGDLGEFRYICDSKIIAGTKGRFFWNIPVVLINMLRVSKATEVRVNVDMEGRRVMLEFRDRMEAEGEEDQK
jgi:hypothetical protein